jgi:hypothetical protein
VPMSEIIREKYLTSKKRVYDTDAARPVAVK